MTFMIRRPFDWQALEEQYAWQQHEPGLRRKHLIQNDNELLPQPQPTPALEQLITFPALLCDPQGG